MDPCICRAHERQETFRLAVRPPDVCMCAHVHTHIYKPYSEALIFTFLWDHKPMACSKHCSYRHLTKTIWKVCTIPEDKILECKNGVLL
jgi:hypothetical protein